MLKRLLSITAAALVFALCLTTLAATTTTATATTEQKYMKQIQTQQKSAAKYESAIEELLEKNASASGAAALTTEYEALKEKYADVRGGMGKGPGTPTDLASKTDMKKPDGDRRPPEGGKGPGDGKQPPEDGNGKQPPKDGNGPGASGNLASGTDMQKPAQLTETELKERLTEIKAYVTALKKLYTSAKKLA